MRALLILKASLTHTYGENFSSSTTTIKTRVFNELATAYTHDAVVYFGTPYKIWEYPVFASGSDKEVVDYLTVIFPAPANLETPAPTIFSGDYPAAPWYNAGHQTFNVWSYPPQVGDIEFQDYDPVQGAFAEVPVGGGGGGFTFSQLNMRKFITTTNKMHDFNYEFALGKETPKFAEEKGFKWDLQASVKGSYKTAEIKTEQQTTSEKTEISGYIGEQPTSSQFSTRALLYQAKGGYYVLDYQTDMPGVGDWEKYYHDPDPAFILPWYGFPAGFKANNAVSPTLNLDLFSPDIQVTPAYASIGMTVTISATLRNFSNHPALPFKVRFCRGGKDCEAGNATYIGEVETTKALDRLNGPMTVSIQWPAAGDGQQRIYAVIDPENKIAEVHDDDDVINNNVAYGLLIIGDAQHVDPGLLSERAYEVLNYNQGRLGQPRRRARRPRPRRTLRSALGSTCRQGTCPKS